jgi:hypothetical protein
MENKKNNVYEEVFIPQVIKWGVITLVVGVITSFFPALYLWSIGIVPSGTQILTGFGLIFAAVGAFYFVEPFSYFPVLGIPGTYLSFLAGNISNLRLPCSAIAQEAAGVKEGTNEGGIISTIAISVSILVNTIILLFGALGLTALINNLPPSILNAFDYILPAIFGSIFGQFLNRSYLLGGIALAIGLFLYFSGLLPEWAILLFLVFSTIFISKILWDKKIIK